MIMSFWDRIKSAFLGNWQKLLDQIPDQDRRDSYRYDEIQKKWVLLQTLPEPEIPILDENRNLKVVTPNFYEYPIKLNLANLRNIFYVELDFLADSLSIVNSVLSGVVPAVNVWYYDMINTRTIGAKVYETAAGEEYGVIAQVDLIPYHTFKIHFAAVAEPFEWDMKFIFSKQKKTKISDTVYDESVFDGITDIGLSKNVFRDEHEAHIALVNPHSTKLNDINNPDADKNFNFALNSLKFGFTAPTHPSYDGAFEIETIGIFTGDLVHIHQHTGNVGPTNLVYIEAVDIDCKVLHLVHNGVIFIFDKDGLSITGNIAVSGTVDGVDIAARDHAPTVAGDLSHNFLANLNDGDVYEHISAAQVAALHAIVVAGDLSHNSLANLNDGDVYEHISAAQVAALHAVLTNLTQLATRNHNDLLNIQGGADLQHLTAAQVAALHEANGGTDYDPDLMIGAAYSAWIPCPFEYGNIAEKWGMTGFGIYNRDNTDPFIYFICTLPTNKGGKKLYVKGFRISIYDADNNDYVNDILLYGARYNAMTLLEIDTTNRKSQGLYTTSFGAKDCSSYEHIFLMITTVTSGVADLIIRGVQVDAYYNA